MRCHGPGPPHDTYRNDGLGWARSDRPLGGRGAREFKGVIWQRRRPIDGCFGTQQCLSFAPCVVVSSAAMSRDVIPATSCSTITASGSPPALQRKLVKRNGLPTAVGSPSVLPGSGGVFRSNAERAQRRASEAATIASQRTEGQARGAVGTHWKMPRVFPAPEAGEKAERREYDPPPSDARRARFLRVKRPHAGLSWSLGGHGPSSFGSIGSGEYSSEDGGRWRACAAEWPDSFPVRGGQLLWK